MQNLVALTLIVVSLSLGGCNDANRRKPTFPVSGSVLIDRKPGEHATVVFHPRNDSTGMTDSGEVIKPRGIVKPDGSFTLTTYTENDGAPQGDYQVTVELWLAGRPDEGPTSRLPLRYSRPDQSGLQAQVRPETTTLQPFTLTKR